MKDFTVFPVGSPNERLKRLINTTVPSAKWDTNLPTAGQRFLLAVSLDTVGLCQGLFPLLSALRTHSTCWEGCVAGIVIDGSVALYTKSVAQELVLAANAAGCTFVSHPLVEGVGDLSNFTIQSQNAASSLGQAYATALQDLIHRIVHFTPPRTQHPNLLVLHASTYGPSNTMDLWSVVQHHLHPDIQVQEIGVRNGAVSDCAGCPYTTCLHFGEEGRCFYGGIMVDDVFPALRQAQGVMLLCPNYNDALSANLTACINRLTSLYRTTDFSQKAVYALVVSGYSGGDIVAKQVLSAFAMNKGFYLPAHFCRYETALQPGEALQLPHIKERMSAFASQIGTDLL